MKKIKLAFAIIIATIVSDDALAQAGQMNGLGRTAEFNDRLFLAISQSAETDVGPRKAGFFCLPNGRYERADFIASESEFRSVLLNAAVEMNRERLVFSMRSVVLKRIKVDLCARNFMPGKSKYFSGQAEFDFQIEWIDGKLESKNFKIDIPKRESKTEAEILKLAVSNLLSLDSRK